MPNAKSPSPPPPSSNDDDRASEILPIPPTNFYGLDATVSPHAGFHPGVLSHMAKDDYQTMPAPVTMDHGSLAEAPSFHRHENDLADYSSQDDRNSSIPFNPDTKESHHLYNNGLDNTMSPSRPRFQREAADLRSSTNSPFRLQMPFITPGQLAFSALQFLPVPVLVLSSLKTVVIANEAMGRLLGLLTDSSDSDEATHVLDQLKGQSLSQVGIDMIQHGRPVWIAWDAFLESVQEDQASCGSQASDGEQQHEPQHAHRQGDTTPTPDSSDKKKGQAQCQQTVVEVVISRGDLTKAQMQLRPTNKKSDDQTFAKMIISVWEIADHQTYFTLTFTNTESTSHVTQKKRPVARPGTLESAERKNIATSSNPPSVASSHGSSSSPLHRISPSAVSLASSPFPPMGPPFKSIQSAPSVLQKMLIIKDALLDNTEQPIIAMWRDGSATYPNAAARRLMDQRASTEARLSRLGDNFGGLGNWVLYTDDFSRKLEPHEYPIAILLRTHTPFSGLRIGVIDPDGKRLVYDALAEAIRDEETGEFLAGVVTYRDVTKLAKEIDRIKEVDAERFKLICDSMPQLVWTTDPRGSLDFFNTRWTEFTGMTLEESVGIYNWTKNFHPDDMPETRRRWEHSLRTGEPYTVEYRCQNKEGEWRWLLGRALPLRNPETGRIEKWFGTCTDVHESIETKLAARRTRQQLLSVISHAHVTIFTVDMNRKITMLEVSATSAGSQREKNVLISLGRINGGQKRCQLWRIGLQLVHRGRC